MIRAYSSSTLVRSSRLYCDCSVTGLCRWWRSANSIAARMSSAGHSLVPQYRALPGRDDVVHRPHGLVDRRVGIVAMAVQHVDEVLLEALERTVDRLHQVLAVERVPHVRHVAVDAPEHLGREHVRVPRPSELLEGTTHDRFAVAARVGLGVVEEVAAGVVRGLHAFERQLSSSWVSNVTQLPNDRTLSLMPVRPSRRYSMLDFLCVGVGHGDGP